MQQPVRILFIAPIPPPINGQSLASGVLLEHLEKSGQFEILLVDTAKPRARNVGEKIGRAFKVLHFLYKAFVFGLRADLVYITISETRMGNLKDLLTYVLLWRKLSSTVIHLHGGAGFRVIMSDPNTIGYRINAFFLRRLKHVVVLSAYHMTPFQGLVPSSRISVVENFALKEIFIGREAIKAKFSDRDTLRICFISNLIPGKGFLELLEGFLMLSVSERAGFQLTFAGEFSDKEAKDSFLARINGHDNISYVGVVRGEEKKKLFWNSHIFALPTYYPYEGQPISILEAYASGNVVITTPHSGIPDIFVDKENGYQVQMQSALAVCEALRSISRAPKDSLCAIAKHNSNFAKSNFTVESYLSKLENLLN